MRWPSFRSSYFYLVPGVLALYFILLAVLVLALHAHGETFSWFATIGDAKEYYTLGQSLLYNHAFTMDGVHHEFFRTLGDPLFVAIVLAVTGSVWGVIFAQIGIVAATAYFIARIGEKLFSRWIGMGAAMLYVLDPTTIVATFLVISDPLYIFFLTGTVLVILSDFKNIYYKALMLGALSGYAVLVRPVGEFIVPILLIWFLMQTLYPCFEKFTALQMPVREAALRALRAAGCMLLVVLLFLVAWMARNYAEGKHFSLSSIGPYNFLFYNTVEYEVSKGMGTRDSLKQQFMQQLGTSDFAQLRDFSYSDKIAGLVKENLKPHFISYVEFHIIKSIPFYIGSSIENNESFLQATKVLPGMTQSPPNISYLILKGHISEAFRDLIANPFGLFERFFWFVVLLFDVLALVFARGSKQLAILFFALLVLAFGLLTGPVSMPRYRLPAEPFMLLTALTGLSYSISFIKFRRSKGI